MTNKKIAQPAEFLTENGLLFEINRHILHPFGISLEVDGENTFSIADHRVNKEHAVYEPAAFEEGLRRANRYLRTEGMKQVGLRKEELGFAIQQLPDPHIKRNGVVLQALVEDEIIEFRVPSEWLEQAVIEWHGIGLEMFLMHHDLEQTTNIYTEAKKVDALMGQAIQ